ncbi:SDR family oxidoreductase [Galbibacter sp. PAP.153]|uniref:SDR family oxidoreductase n=1 Tax=Galbibacter sp. PAP.153 TaxID=3104623 RepID=UPI00300AB3D5
MKSKIENKRILVTGGAGFIGSNIVEQLLQQNNEVVCLDNFSTGKYENISLFNENNRFRLVVGDIRDYSICISAVDGIDYVLHQAALGSVPRSINDPITTNEVNVSGFLNMLNASKEAKVKRFVYAASSSTYGDHPSLPKIEEIIGNPLSPYAVTKYVNELYAKVFSNIYELETIGLRYFNVFGRRQDSKGSYAAVIPKFIESLIDLKSPIINGSGEHSRDFTYIDNVVQINQLAALSKTKESLNTVYNVGCEESISLNKMYVTLRELLSFYDERISEVKPVYGPERKGDVKHSLADISKAKKMLGYNPYYKFEDGITESVNWYWENLKVRR